MAFTTSTILALIFGIFGGVGCSAAVVAIKNKGTNSKANKLLEDAKKQADRQRAESLAQIKEESYRLKQELDKEIKQKKEEAKEQDNRMLAREASLDKRDEMLQKREAMLDEKDNNLLKKQKELQEKDAKMDEMIKEEIGVLETISKLSKEKAKEQIMKRVEEEMQIEINAYIKEQEQEAKLQAHEKAKNLIVESMSRYSEDIATGQTVSTISLPSDEMKGRLIGREGRNIRTIEAVTGVDLIIDDTPEAIVISSFDPLRREIAKITIETLIKDGRIHPTRIEEVYDRVCKDMNNKITEMGNNAIVSLNIAKMDPELVNLVGKLNFRTSFGQNCLQHSIEVANLCGLMAQELGENVALAKRAGLLHDIGKAIDFEVEGSHVELGLDIAKKYKEDEIVCNAIASHHGDTEQTSVISVLVQVADTLSAARPGARNDSAENYIKRLEQLESIGNEYDGVDKAYALQAGRELRVIVKPTEISDEESFKLARKLKEQIESQMQYPGTIKITVTRETRAQEEAK